MKCKIKNIYSLYQGIDRIRHFRMYEHEELLGADYMEHNIHHPSVGVSRAVSVLKEHKENVDLQLVPVGKNKGKRVKYYLAILILIIFSACTNYYLYCFKTTISGHMDFLERKYVNKQGIRLRLKDMVQIAPLQEDEARPKNDDIVKY